MELFSVLLMLTILVIILIQNSKTSTNLQKLENELKLLRRQLLNFTSEKKEVTEQKVQEVPKPAEETKAYTSIFTVADEKAPAIIPVAEDAVLKTAEENLPESKQPEPVSKVTTVEIKEVIEPPKERKKNCTCTNFF